MSPRFLQGNLNFIIIMRVFSASMYRCLYAKAFLIHYFTNSQRHNSTQFSVYAVESWIICFPNEIFLAHGANAYIFDPQLIPVEAACELHAEFFPHIDFLIIDRKQRSRFKRSFTELYGLRQKYAQLFWLSHNATLCEWLHWPQQKFAMK